MEILDFENEKMACFPNGEGAISESPGFTPSENGILISFNSPTEINQTLKQITALGGKICQPKTKIKAEDLGYFATFIDSEGNKIGLYQD